jgi:riboflavin kinase/FMN adenylyltransferase
VITSFELAHLPAPAPGGSVVSIGVFDGVHLGHQAILAANRARAGALGAIPAVITFRRHPKRVLLGREPRTLTSLEHRLELFRQAGVEHVLVLSFDEALRELEPEEFVERYALEALGARAFVLGFDSKFGRDRRGTPELLKRLGYDVEVVREVLVSGRAVSSTAIREAVELGDLEGARRMLGRPVAVLGTVVAGDGRGRTLGFPTANLNLHHELHPPQGVYAGWARVFRRERPEGAREHAAVANVGLRPTVAREAPHQREPHFEVHLLDFEGDLYGANIEFRFEARLRAEQRFESLAALSAQIQEDVAAARLLLGRERTSGVDAPRAVPR